MHASLLARYGTTLTPISWRWIFEESSLGVPLKMFTVLIMLITVFFFPCNSTFSLSKFNRSVKNAKLSSQRSLNCLYSARFLSCRNWFISGKEIGIVVGISLYLTKLHLCEAVALSGRCQPCQAASGRVAFEEICLNRTGYFCCYVHDLFHVQNFSTHLLVYDTMVT